MRNTSKKSPAFQFYPQDFISSLDVQTMTAAQVGAYCLLLFNSWMQEPQAMLPNDDDILRSLSRMTTKEWNKSKSKLLKKFKETDCGKYRFNPRMYNELVLQQQHRERQSQNGRKGGRPKKAKENPEKTQPETQKEANDNPVETKINPPLKSGNTKHEPKKSSSSSSSSSSSTSIKITKTIVVELPEFLKTDQFLKEGREFIKMRKGIKKNMTEYAFKRLVKKLVRLSDGDHNLACQILAKSTDCSWLDVYPMDKARNNPKKTQRKANPAQKKDLDKVNYG